MTAALATDARPADKLRVLFSELLNRHDAGALVAYWAEDVVEEFPTGKVVGREALRQYFADVFAAIPDFHIEAKSIAGEGDLVFVRWHATGTFSGARWMGLEPTGSRLALDGIDAFTFRNGLIQHNFVVYDQLAFARQIGLMPPMGSPLDKTLMGVFNAKTRLFRKG
jgi:steroid delta-isomerase-like uncharacterized protein